DLHPTMVRVAAGGSSIAVEIWSVPADGVASILLGEPPGLAIRNVQLVDDQEVLGVVGELILCDGTTEITQYGGWRDGSPRSPTAQSLSMTSLAPRRGDRGSGRAPEASARVAQMAGDL